jgi:hypothetical protein
LLLSVVYATIRIVYAILVDQPEPGADDNSGKWGQSFAAKLKQPGCVGMEKVRSGDRGETRNPDRSPIKTKSICESDIQPGAI